MDVLVVALDDPWADDVRALLETHLAFTAACTPPEDIYALDLDGLTGPGIAFYSARRAGRLLGFGALLEWEPGHGELKSMHTTAEARGQGVARAMVEHLVGEARARGYKRVSLETGTQDEFAPARALYAACGFVPCGPFSHYTDTRTSALMTLAL